MHFGHLCSHWSGWVNHKPKFSEWFFCDWTFFLISSPTRQCLLTSVRVYFHRWVLCWSSQKTFLVMCGFWNVLYSFNKVSVCYWAVKQMTFWKHTWHIWPHAAVWTSGIGLDWNVAAWNREFCRRRWWWWENECKKFYLPSPEPCQSSLCVAGLGSGWVFSQGQSGPSGAPVLVTG